MVTFLLIPINLNTQLPPALNPWWVASGSYFCWLPSGYDIATSPWKIPMFKFGKPSISIRAIYTMANC